MLSIQTTLFEYSIILLQDQVIDNREGPHVPTANERANFRRSLDSSSNMIFHHATGLPLQSSPVSIYSEDI